MVDISLKSSVQVRGGPMFAMAATMEPTSYTLATVNVAKNTSKEVPLLANEGVPMLLAIRAYDAEGKKATIGVTPKKDGQSGKKLNVVGNLLLAHSGALDALVTGGPRSVTVENAGDKPVVVEILAGLAPAPDTGPDPGPGPGPDPGPGRTR
ncbi:hypothetical protein [Catellatospora chokoriensis]|nr:hypothetical protein [Catellatospora chokoriensis]